VPQKGAHQLILKCVHLAGIGLMIVPQQMQNGMQNQEPDFDFQGPPGFPGLSSRRRQGDRDIPEIRAPLLGGMSGKGEDIGAPIHAPEPPVQSANLGVVREQQADLSACSEGAQRSAGGLHDWLQAPGSKAAAAEDLHGDSARDNRGDAAPSQTGSRKV